MAINKFPGGGPMAFEENPAALTTSEMLRQKFGVDDQASLTASVCTQLKELYKTNVKPLEKQYNYHKYLDRPIPDGEFEAKPMVLLLGQKGAGKTTFVKHMLGRDYPGMKIGPEVSTDHFNAVMYGEVDDVVTGHVVCSDTQLPFQPLGSFGNNFMESFRVCKTNSPTLRDLWFIDTPPMISATVKEVGYEFANVYNWFAKKASLILLFFEPGKVRPTSDLEAMVNILRNHHKKIKIIFNKATILSEPDVATEVGDLMWTLSMIFSKFSPRKPIKVHISSFPENGNDVPPGHKCASLFLKDSSTVMKMLEELPRRSVMAKMKQLRKRAARLKVHMKLFVYFKEQLPRFFGKKTMQHEMRDHMDDALTRFCQESNVNPEEVKYMKLSKNKDLFMVDNLSKYKTTTKKSFEKLDAMVQRALPQLLNELSGGVPGVDLDRELAKMGLLKNKRKKLKPREGSRTASRTGGKALSKNKSRTRVDSDDDGETVASGKSKFSMKSAGKIFGVSKVLSKIKRPGKGSVKSRKSFASNLSPGSIADDAISQYTKKTKKGPAYSKTAKQISDRKTQMSFVEQSVAGDDHLDLFSEMSDDSFQGRKNDFTFGRGDKSVAPKSVASRNSKNKTRTRAEPSREEQSKVDRSSLPPSIRSKHLDALSDGSGTDDAVSTSDDWQVPSSARMEAAEIFETLGVPTRGKIDGQAGMRAFARFNVADRVMRHIWQLVDINGANALDQDQLALAIFLLKKAKKGEPVPRELPIAMIPPNHRVN